MNASRPFCPLSFNTTKYFIIPIYSIVLTIGLPLNCLALSVLVPQIKRSVILSVYVLNLVLANILQIITLPFWINDSYHDHKWVLGQEACVVIGMVFITNSYAKNNFLCLIAMERYFGVVHPLKFHRLQTMHGATKVSIATWLLVTTGCAVGLWLQIKGSGARQGHCLDASQLRKDYAHFKMATMSVSFLMPCVLMGFFYFRILYELRKAVSLLQTVKRQVYRFISLILASFFLFWTPFQVICCYKYYWELRLEEDELCDFERNSIIYTHVTWCLTTLDNIVDPFLYILLLKDAQAEFKNHFSFRILKMGTKYKLEQQDLLPHSASAQTQHQTGIQKVTQSFVTEPCVAGCIGSELGFDL